MKLHEAFEITRGDVVAFIGAGGKTSTLVRLGYELADLKWRVLATTTTRIAEEQLKLFPYAMPIDAGNAAISEALNRHRYVFIYETVSKGKVYGPDPAWLPTLLDSIDSDVLLVEADGARGLPLKAPYQHEPVIPPDTTLVVPVASLAVLGQPLDGNHVYNAQAMIDRYGYYPGSRIKSPWVAQVLRDESLGLSGIPEKARIAAFLNQTPATGYLRGRARLIAQLALRSSRLNSVSLGMARSANPVHEVQRPVAAVVLAAGLSRRMGQPKVLLPWTEQKTIIEHIVEQLIRSRIDPITVVTGHHADEVKSLVKPLGCKVVFNRAYRTGEMLSSLKAGLRALPENIAAAMIVLGDQPRLDPRVIHQVMTAYAENASVIVAPSFEMRRGHPIIISRRLWPELLALRGDAQPRDVINAHADQITYVNVNTDSILRDVDTPQDYNEERYRAGLGRYGKRPRRA